MGEQQREHTSPEALAGVMSEDLRPYADGEHYFVDALFAMFEEFLLADLDSCGCETLREDLLMKLKAMTQRVETHPAAPGLEALTQHQTA